MNINLEKHSDGKVDIKSYGLSLTIDPMQLYRETCGEHANDLLESMVKKQLKSILDELSDFYYNSYLQDTRDGRYLKEQVDNKNITVDMVKDLAQINRYILPLLSNGEEVFENFYNNLPPKMKELMDWSFRLSGYCSLYGFKSRTNENVYL